MNFKKVLLIFLSSVSLITSNNLRFNQEKNFAKSKLIIKGINWFGFETEYKNLMCTWKHDIEWNLKRMKEFGFNYIRLPFSMEFVRDANWEQMDIFFEKSKELGFDVVLDAHRITSYRQSEKPYDNNFRFDDFLNGWKTILDRYKDYDNLKAVDIFNEYQSGDYVEWNYLAKQIVNFIENNFPERFDFFIGGTNWGGNIHNMDLSDLPFQNRIYYSIHKYWFSDSPPYEEKWNYSFGDKELKNVGEWGYMSEVQSETEWAENFVKYLKKNNVKDTFFWTWTDNSYDTKGCLKEDCETIDYKKMLLLHHLWED